MLHLDILIHNGDISRIEWLELFDEFEERYIMQARMSAVGLNGWNCLMSLKRGMKFDLLAEAQRVKAKKEKLVKKRELITKEDATIIKSATNYGALFTGKMFTILTINKLATSTAAN